MKPNTRKILFALLLNLLLFLVLMFVLDATGTFSLGRLFSSLGLIDADPAKIEDPYLLERAELEKQWLALSLREDDHRGTLVTHRSNEQWLSDKQEHLLAFERQLMERERKIQEDERGKVQRSELVRNVAVQLMNMPPEQAVERLEGQEDDLFIIDILFAMDALSAEQGQTSLVPYYLSLMTSARVAAIQRKMATINTINESEF